MIGRPLRVLCLAVAAWAVLFAPGAAAEQIPELSASEYSNHVGAAVAAPTFDAGDLAMGRACRIPTPDDDRSCGDRSFTAPALGVTLTAASLVAFVAIRRIDPPTSALVRFVPQRGPPSA